MITKTYNFDNFNNDKMEIDELINNFLDSYEYRVVDIKYSTCAVYDGERTYLISSALLMCDETQFNIRDDDE